MKTNKAPTCYILLQSLLQKMKKSTYGFRKKKNEKVFITSLSCSM